MGRVTRERPLLLRRRPPIRGRQFMLNAHEHNKSDTAGKSAEAGATLQRASDSGDRRRGGDEDGTRWGSRTALSSPEVASVPPSRANAGRSPIEVKGGGGDTAPSLYQTSFYSPNHPPVYNYFSARMTRRREAYGRARHLLHAGAESSSPPLRH